MAYAWRHGLEFTLPNKTKDPEANPIYLQHLVNPRYDPTLPQQKIVEQSHAFQYLPFKKEWAKYNIVLDGYWQTEKYFKEHRDRVLEAFGYSWFLAKDFVSVHVRRGDYLTLRRKHPEVTVEWYTRAMAKFPGMQFMFFSDDLPWCRQVFGHREDVQFAAKQDCEKDLICMSRCEHHICSASTFSWWGAWLNRNPDKRIIFPNWWFTPGYQGLQTHDIVPKEWERQS